LRVRQGKGWLAFRRYRTRDGGHFAADYLFRRTTRPTTYEMRAQVRESGGYPYLEGESDPVQLKVLAAKSAPRCPPGRWAHGTRRGKRVCLAQPRHRGHRKRTGS
jgi:hypothetical protein